MREPPSHPPDETHPSPDETWIPEVTRPPVDTDPAANDATISSADRPVLVAVAIYGETAPEAEDRSATIRSELGRCVSLRAGDVLFVGKPPGARKLRRPDGSMIAVTHSHLFPRIRAYQYVSKKHLGLEMREDGSIALLDYSANGSYLVNAARHVRRNPADEDLTQVTVRGPETVVLGIDLSLQRDTRMMEYANRHRLQIVFLRSPSGDPRQTEGDAEATVTKP